MHQYSSLAEVQSSLQLDGQQLFNTAVSFQMEMEEVASASNDSIACRKIRDFNPTEVRPMISNFDAAANKMLQYILTLNGLISKSTIELVLDYWSPSISIDKATSIASTFTSMLSAFISNPGQTLENLDSSAMLQTGQLREWNQTVPTKLEICFHNIFESLAMQQPDAEAIWSKDATYSYARLEEMSTRLACHLVGLGVRPEVLVPLCFEKSALVIVAMLAVLKAGGAFVPIDPSHPAVSQTSDYSRDRSEGYSCVSQHSTTFRRLYRKGIGIRINGQSASIRGKANYFYCRA